MSAKLKYSHVKHIERADLITGGEAITVTIVYADLINKMNVTQNEIIDHITERLKDEPKAEPFFEKDGKTYKIPSYEDPAKDFYCLTSHHSQDQCDVQCRACNLSSK